jgi:hypothetical protein
MVLVHANPVQLEKLHKMKEAKWRTHIWSHTMKKMHITVRRVHGVLMANQCAEVMLVVFSLRSAMLSVGVIVIVAIVLSSRG